MKIDMEMEDDFRINDLDELINGIEILVDNLTDKYYIQALTEIKEEAEKEKEKFENDLVKYQKQELEYENDSFEKLRL